MVALLYTSYILNVKKLMRVISLYVFAIVLGYAAQISIRICHDTQQICVAVSVKMSA